MEKENLSVLIFILGTLILLAIGVYVAINAGDNPLMKLFAFGIGVFTIFWMIIVGFILSTRKLTPSRTTC